MNCFRIIIADDDLPSRMLLLHFVKLLPEFEVIAETVNGEELIRLVMEEKPDIALVDINMPGVNGFEAVKACKKILPSLHVIFTTGYDEFAVEAFNISAVDYIIKPIERARLFGALEKAKRIIQFERSFETQSIDKFTRKLIIRTNNVFLYLSLDDILFLEREGRKTLIHTIDNQYETSNSLQDYEKKLPTGFYKTHRSYLVNMRKIVKIEPSGETYLAYFAGTEKVAYISKLKINEVQDILHSQ